jgi:hypothetical protein
MAEVVNLRAVRKGKAKAEARAQADENAMKFGLSKAQKAREAAEAARAAAALDGKKRDGQD